MFALVELEPTSCFGITLDSRIFHSGEVERIHASGHNARKMADSMDPSCMAGAWVGHDILAFAYMGHGCNKDMGILDELAIRRIEDVVHNVVLGCKPLEFAFHLSDKIGFSGVV